jgi:hypothetical protein
MAYVTGSASSFADLLSALQAACTGNGYTLTGNVLSKGTLFAEVTIISQTNPALRVRGGSGQSAGVLSGASNMQSAQLGLVTNVGSPMGSNPFAFPMTYYIHVNTAPDEVYLVVNYNGNQYQFIAFGQSSVAGLTGTGNWYAGTDVASNRQVVDIDIRSIGGYMETYNLNGGLFQGLSGYPASQNGAVDHQLDSATWSVEGAWRDWWPLTNNSPNGWNGESVLLPVTVYAARPSGFVSIVAELAHARFVAIDNLSDQQIITLGSDKWKVYPWWKRSARAMPPNSNKPGTATLGHAFRYDGP